MGSETEDTFRQIFYKLMLEGKFVSPRGQLVLEAENFHYELPPFVRFQSFKQRKFNLNYVKDELLWYLKGDRYDLSICEKAKIWKGIVNEDGSINSNYGQYLFTGGQFDRAVRTLIDDKDSRRASMMILQPEHLLGETKDVPCTYALNFRIRENALNMTVHMRSQDAIFGMGNDAPAFSFIHELLLNVLRQTYPDLKCGSYHQFVDSFHVYERHFDMIQSITQVALDDNHYDGPAYEGFVEIDCPRISGPAEAVWILSEIYRTKRAPEHYKFARWLLERD